MMCPDGTKCPYSDLMQRVNTNVAVIANEMQTVERHLREINGSVAANTQHRQQQEGRMIATEKTIASFRNWLVAAVVTTSALAGLVSFLAEQVAKG